MGNPKQAVATTVLAGLLWGSSFVVIKIGLESLDPYWFAFLRFATATVIAVSYAAVTGRLRVLGRLLKNPLVILFGISNAVGFIMQFKGQTMTTAGKAALFVNLSTIFVAVGSRFMFRERFGPLKVVAVVAGMIGVFLVTTGGRFTIASPTEFAGDMIILGGAVAWTFFILLDKKIVHGTGVDIRALTAAQVLLTAATALPAALIFAPRAFPSFDASWWAILYTAVFCTVIPFMLWTSGLRYISATVSSVILLIEILFAIVLAAVLLGETLAPVGIVGAGLIALAAYLATRGQIEKAAPGPDIVPE
ncbi:MAG: EamA family transporter [Candidatus Eisenbacteria bacterium]|nr:EamA family transporter [Candidatus Eisenbacteria bacterium]